MIQNEKKKGGLVRGPFLGTPSGRITRGSFACSYSFDGVQAARSCSWGGGGKPSFRVVNVAKGHEGVVYGTFVVVRHARWLSK